MHETDISDDTLEGQNEVAEKSQRRSVAAIVLGGLLIAFCLFSVAIFVSAFFHPIDPPVFAIMGSPIFLLLAWLAYRQYCALFCCEPIAARAFHEAYITIGIFALFAFVTNMLEDTTRFMKNKDNWPLFAGMLLFGLFCIFVGFWHRGQMILRRRDRLRSNQVVQSYRKRKIFGLLLLTGCTTVLAAYFVYDMNQTPVVGEHLSHDELPFKGAFPPEGSDFSFRRGYRGTGYYEFTIDEAAFRRWINSQSRWEYCVPIDGGVSISHSVHPRKEDEAAPHVTDGLVAGYGEHRGGRAVFDRETKRAYYWTYY